MGACTQLQELLLLCPQLHAHPEYLIAAMTKLLVNGETLLLHNCVLYDQVSSTPPRQPVSSACQQHRSKEDTKCLAALLQYRQVALSCETI